MPRLASRLADVANQVGQNKIAINFIWTLITGFLVMFMQAGFAMVEAGLCRVKNANHTYMMNFLVYACGLFAYWIIGFAIQMGGAAGNGNLGGLQPLASEHLHQPVRHQLGHLRPERHVPCRAHLRRRRHGHLPVPDGLHGYGADHRDRSLRRALEVPGLCGLLGADGRLHLSALRQLGMGRWLAFAARAPTSAWAKATATLPAPA